MAKGMAALAAGCALVTGLATAAGSNSVPVTPRTEGSGNPVIESLVFNSPHDVIQIRATTAAARMMVDTQDCCITGDKWSIRVIDLSNGKVTDVRGTGNGSTAVPTGTVNLYRGGSQPIDALVEVRYAQGVAVFPAGMSVRFVGVPDTEVINTTVQTTLVPLPSH